MKRERRRQNVSGAPAGSAPTRTLALAAKTLGGAQALAERLNVEHATLERWMAGEEVPPPVRRLPQGARRASATSGQFRQVQPRDGAPASNRPDAGQNKKSKG